jgi:hypothetical protein
MKRFVEGTDRDQITLFPAVLDDYVGEDNPVREECSAVPRSAHHRWTSTGILEWVSIHQFSDD